MSELSIQVCSDLDYEGMVVDICSKDGRIATINCDRGIENPEIIIFDNERERVVWKLDYFPFRKIMDGAFEKLKEVNVLDDGK